MYNKRRILLKFMAVMISISMLLGLLPMTTMAIEEDLDLQQETSLQAPMLGAGLAMWAGEKLAGGVIAGIAGYGVNEAFGAIFGTETDRVMQTLEEIKAGIASIKSDIENLSSKLDQGYLKDDLSEFGAFINNYVSLYNKLNEARKLYSNNPAMTKQFLLQIYTANDLNYLVNGETPINATIKLGEDLIRKRRGNYNIFGAYDLMDKYINIWEHQGYTSRQKFRDNALGIYMMYSAMSQLACQTIIDNNPGDDDISKFKRSEAEIYKRLLQNNASQVAMMNNRCAVIRHPDLRIARDVKRGTDLCAFRPEINIAWVTKAYWGDEASWAYYSQSESTYTSVGYLWSLTRDYTAYRVAWSQGWEVYTNQPTPDEYQTLLSNYNGTQSLYSIFFDADKGNFYNVGGHADGLGFLCNHYVSRRRYNNRITWESHYHMGNYGEVYTWWEFSNAYLRYDGTISANWFDHSNAFIVNKYTGEVKQGMLQAPLPPTGIETGAVISGMDPYYELPYNNAVTLEIDKTGNAYQWYLNKNDNKGFIEIEGAVNQTYTISEGLTPEMNGWKYSCIIIDDPLESEEDFVYTYSTPVLLTLTGEGVLALVTEHEVGDESGLAVALSKVDSGEWDGHTLKLTKDIFYPNTIALDNLHSMNIDLNGFSLTIQPQADAQPNVNSMTDNPQIAAISLNGDNVEIIDSSAGGTGKLQIIAGAGISYGLYATNFSRFYDASGGKTSVTITDGGTAIYVDEDSTVKTIHEIQAEGNNAYGLECLNMSTVEVGGNVTVTGASACGAFVTSTDGGTPNVSISGDLNISGENSRGIFLDADTELIIKGSITVTGGTQGIMASNGSAVIGGNITAPENAVNAWGENTQVSVTGNVSVTNENAVAVSGAGSKIDIKGSVSSTGIRGTGVRAATWISPEDGTEHGSFVTIDGKINAVTPLLIENTSIDDENDRSSVEGNYYVFTVPEKGAGTVKAVPGSFEVIATSVITFNKNGGDTQAVPATIVVFPGDTIGNLPAAPIRSGHTFNGWNTAADGSGTAFTANIAITTNITVYAQWTGNSTPEDAGSPSGGGTSTTSVTFNKNGGDTEADPTIKTVVYGGNSGSLPLDPTRSGYTFNGWNTEADGSGNSFTSSTVITSNIIVYAQWIESDLPEDENSTSEEDTSTPTPITPITQTSVSGSMFTARTMTAGTTDSSGKVTVTLTSSQLNDAITKAWDAGKQETEFSARVEIKVETSNDAKTIETVIPKESFDMAANSGILEFTISTPVADISFDKGALSTISGESAEDIRITVSRVEASTLSSEVQQIVGDRPVFNFNVMSKDRTISEFGGNVSVSIPYTPKTGEDLDSIIIYYINSEGDLEIVSNCIYDPSTGMVSFSTNHFSKYAIGYNKVSFKDVAEKAWYSRAVSYIAARGITTGTGNGNFSPDAKLTRGDFLVLMMRAYGIAPDVDLNNNFSDAGSTYYTGYLAAAKRLGISKGIGNNMYAPNKEITRQEMFTLLYNVLKSLDMLAEGTNGNLLSSFNDAQSIDSWANEALKFLVETGTIKGNGQMLYPKNTTTRAEMAQVLFNLLSK